MKFSENTIKVLENFSKINSSILFLEGTKQKTMDPSGTFLASVDIAEDLPKEFGIYKLSTFLSILSLFDDPDITFNDESMEIEEGDSKITYVYCAPSLIKHPPKNKNITIKDPLFSVELSEDRLTKLITSAKVLGLPHLVLAAEDGKLTASLTNIENSKVKDSFVIDLGEDDEASDGSVTLEIGGLSLVSDDYAITVSKKIVQFESQKKGIEYFAAVTA